MVTRHADCDVMVNERERSHVWVMLLLRKAKKERMMWMERQKDDAEEMGKRGRRRQVSEARRPRKGEHEKARDGHAKVQANGLLKRRSRGQCEGAHSRRGEERHVKHAQEREIGRMRTKMRSTRRRRTQMSPDGKEWKTRMLMQRTMRKK
jgi:hypothetical protein